MHVRLQRIATLMGTALAGATLLGSALLGGCSRPPQPAATPAAGCFLATRLKGALEAAIDWRGSALLCEGGARPEGRGLRASFAGKGPQGEALRFVFGLAATPGSPESRNVATHLTLIVEGSGTLYATQGDEQCTTELLQQVPLAAQPGQWRVQARGYCIDPAATLDARAHLYMERFDFEGQAHFDPEDLHVAGTPPPTARPDWPHARLDVHTSAGTRSFAIDVADNPEREELGLMYVRMLPAGLGMLFPVRPVRSMQMWMKNTYIPLDMLFIDAQGHVACVRERTTPLSLAIIDCPRPSSAVLEIAGGEAHRLGIRPGDTVDYPVDRP